VAEHIDPAAPPPALSRLRELGLQVVPHGISLSLGGADHPDKRRLGRLAALAEELDSPLVSEHVAYVRAGDLEAGHLLPVPRTTAALDVLVENVLEAQDALPVPLALEHVAALLEWPDPELDEAEFLGRLLDQTGAMLLVDLANLFANSWNHGFDAAAWLEHVPLDRLAYVHVGGGAIRDGIYHDSHSDPVVPEVVALVEELCARVDPPGVLLERDDHFPPTLKLLGELDAIAHAVGRGGDRRASTVRG